MYSAFHLHLLFLFWVSQTEEPSKLRLAMLTLLSNIAQGPSSWTDRVAGEFSLYPCLEFLLKRPIDEARVIKEVIRGLYYYHYLQLIDIHRRK